MRAKNTGNCRRRPPSASCGSGRSDRWQGQRERTVERVYAIRRSATVVIYNVIGVIRLGLKPMSSIVKEKPAAGESRSHPRKPFPWDAAMDFGDGSPLNECKIVDISAGGARIR